MHRVGVRLRVLNCGCPFAGAIERAPELDRDA
jgi:hypothetical protein